MPNIAARLHAAELQERLGISVQASTSNDWEGYYFIVDHDRLEQLADKLDAAKEAARHLQLPWHPPYPNTDTGRAAECLAKVLSDA